MLQPTMKQVERFTVTGFSLRTQNSDEFNEKKAKLPSLWQQFYTSELAAINLGQKNVMIASCRRIPWFNYKFLYKIAKYLIMR